MKKQEAIKELSELEQRTVELKKIIEEQESDITDKIKSYEDACKLQDIDPSQDLPYMTPKNSKQIALNAAAKLMTITMALNEGWRPDWNNSDQYKYWPWFNMKSGFGFSFTDYVFWGTGTHVGSRLCFKSEELSDYAGRQFKNIYEEWLK